MKTRRILSFVVAAILVASTLCVAGLLNVFAEEIEIDTAEEFKAITDGNYKLTADIDLTGVDFTTIASFSGTLDGNGKTVTTSKPLFGTLAGEVKNLTIAGEITTDATTAIGVLANKAVGALKLTGVTNKASVTATASASVGGFIGEVTGTNAVTFTGCINDGAITATGVVTGVGGFVGTVIGSAKDAHASVTVERSVNNGAVTINTTISGMAGAAGFVGSGDMYTLNFTESLNYGDIDFTSVNNGGPAGFFGTALKWESGKDNSRDTLIVRYCANYGDITAHSNVQGPGGIAGRLNRGMNMTYTFEYCYNVGKITGGNYAGAIFSYTNNSTGTKLTVKGCYNVGEITGSSYSHMVGLSGSLKPTLTENNFYIGDPKTKTNEVYPINGTSCADKAALNEKLLALGEYAVDPAKNDGYAILKWQCAHEDGTNCLGKCYHCGEQLAASGSHAWGSWVETKPATEFANGEKERVCSACGEKETEIIPSSGNVTPVDGVYQITNADQLIWLANNMNTGAVPANAKIAIKADITLPDGMPYINKKFTGTFDGEGHTISGMNNMLFAQLNGTVQNVTLNGTVTSTAERVGIVTPYAITNAKVINVHSSASVTTTAGNLNVAGLVGYAKDAFTMENCSFSGTVTANWTSADAGVGGLVGWSNANGAKFVMTNCYFDGEIVVNASSAVASKSIFIGGVVGHAGSSGSHKLSYCTSVGKITLDKAGANYFIGGVVGRFNLDSAKCYYAVFNGEIEAPAGTFVGGILGHNTRAGAWLESCAVLKGDHDVCAFGILADVNCYTRNGVQEIGAPFTLGGVQYQRYNFGYINTETSEMMETTAATAAKAYASIRDKAEAHDLRVTVIADGALELNMTVTFKKGNDTVKTVETQAEKYLAFLADGEPYFAAEETAFYTVAVGELADGSWDTVTVTVTDADGKTLVNAASIAYADLNA